MSGRGARRATWRLPLEGTQAEAARARAPDSHPRVVWLVPCGRPGPGRRTVRRRDRAAKKVFHNDLRRRQQRIEQASVRNAVWIADRAGSESAGGASCAGARSRARRPSAVSAWRFLEESAGGRRLKCGNPVLVHIARRCMKTQPTNSPLYDVVLASRKDTLRSSVREGQPGAQRTSSLGSSTSGSYRAGLGAMSGLAHLRAPPRAGCVPGLWRWPASDGRTPASARRR
jgi:hypothetical protein